MKCPVDGTELKMSERQGIEIDYCPKCRGVWLDRGELDKIIDRSAADMAPTEPVITASASPVGGLSRPMQDTSLRNPDQELIDAKKRAKERAEQLEQELKLERERAKMRERERERDRYDDRDRSRSRSRDDDRYDDDRRYKKRKKRKSFLGEIFDFDFD
ncbi:MAG: zf-TFIIB domain-containing protein [Pseudomonadota bacterium]